MNEEKPLAQMLKEYVENLERRVKEQHKIIEELRLTIGHNLETEKQLKADLSFLRNKNEELKEIISEQDDELSEFERCYT